MADIIPPKPARLDLAQFPAEGWARILVSAFNQFALQVVQALTIAAPKYKVIDFSTGADPIDSFPIDFPVPFAPNEVRVAAVLVGDTGFDGITAKWSTTIKNSNSLCVRIRWFSGLSSNTTYSIRLAYQ